VCDYAHLIYSTVSNEATLGNELIDFEEYLATQAGRTEVKEIFSAESIFGVKGVGVHYLKDGDGKWYVVPNEYGGMSPIVATLFKDDKGNYKINEVVRKRFEDAGLLELYKKWGYDKIDFGTEYYIQLVESGAKKAKAGDTPSALWEFFWNLEETNPDGAREFENIEMKEFQARVDILFSTLLNPENSPIGINYAMDGDQRYVYPKKNIEERVKTQKQWNIEWGWQNELWNEYDNKEFKQLHKLILLEKYNKGTKHLLKNMPGYNEDDYIKDRDSLLKKIDSSPLGIE
jgi:hypothetical protein